MHRVLNLNAIGKDFTIIEGHKIAIREKLATYSTYEAQVNDGRDESDRPTLAIQADFNSVTDANEFHSWLKSYLVSSNFDFVSARTRVHDCYHAEGMNLPCQIGDVWDITQGAPIQEPVVEEPSAEEPPAEEPIVE